MFTHLLLSHGYINRKNRFGIYGLVDCSQPRFRERGLRGILSLFANDAFAKLSPDHVPSRTQASGSPSLSTSFLRYKPSLSTQCQSPKLRSTSSHSSTRTCASPLLIRACFWGNSNALIRFVSPHIPLFSHPARSTLFNFRYSSIQFDCKG